MLGTAQQRLLVSATVFAKTSKQLEHYLLILLLEEGLAMESVPDTAIW